MDDSGKGQGGAGKFSVEYEIRRIPLPTWSLRLSTSCSPPYPDDVVCMTV